MLYVHLYTVCTQYVLKFFKYFKYLETPTITSASPPKENVPIKNLIGNILS